MTVVNEPIYTFPGTLTQNRQDHIHILTPVTDNCPTWVRGRGQMAKQIISWQNHNRSCVAGMDGQIYYPIPLWERDTDIIKAAN